MKKKRKGKKEKERRRSKKWVGPAQQAAHVPLPLLLWLRKSFIIDSPPALLSR
jgi:hypothetical protein